MKTTKIVLILLIGSMLAVATPVDAKDDGTGPGGPCVTTSTNPPDVIVDPACLRDTIEDVIPPPGP